MIPGKGEILAARNQTIQYEFFKKTKATRLTILQCSAVSVLTKVITMVSEILKRWKRTSENLSSESFRIITRQLMNYLLAMGYNEEWRRNIIKNAITGYRSIFSDRNDGRTK